MIGVVAMMIASVGLAVVAAQLPGEPAAPARGPSSSASPSEICCGGGGGTEYNVNFEETGLGSGESWKVTLAGVSLKEDTSTITFEEEAGTYSYTVHGVAGLTPNPSSGSVTITTAAKSVQVTYSTTLFTLTFKATGLGAAKQWTVTMPSGTPPRVGGTSTEVFQEPNGTYAFTVDPPTNYGANPPAGNITVDNKSLTETIAFSSTVYSVKFVGADQPSGALWSVTLNTTKESTTGSTVTFSSVLDGVYPFVVTPPLGYAASPSSGTVTVDAKAVTRDISFSPILWNVTFDHPGAVACYPWFVTVDGQNSSGAISGSSYLTHLADGQHTYSYASSSASCSRGSGEFTVDNADLPVPVVFSTRGYAVTLTAVDLPTGTPWTIHFAYGGSAATSASSMVLEKPNGTFPYTITTSNLRYAAPPGSVPVAGEAVSQNVTFHLVEESLTFTVHDLPSGASWGVSVNGTPEYSEVSTIGFSVPNGTYGFTVLPPSGYLAAPAAGSVAVSGETGRTILLTSLVFEETGLPTGTGWSVRIGGTNYTSWAAQLAVPVPNGTYNYTVSSTGRTPTPGNNSATVIGAPTVVPVSFALTHYTVSFTTSGLPSGDSWYVTLNGTNRSSEGSTISFAETGLGRQYGYAVSAPGGYAVYPSQGTVAVGTGPVATSIVMGPPHLVTFTGAYAGWTWSVTVGGLKETNVGGSIYFEEPSGTFLYHVSAETVVTNGVEHAGYPADGGNGNFTVLSSDITVTVSFETVTSVTFDELNLPAGTQWTVDVNGTGFESTGSTLTVEVAPFSNVSFVVPPPTGFTVYPAAGVVQVGYSPENQSLEFGHGYAVTFSGAPTGGSWSVRVGGVTEDGTGGTIVFEEPNGTFGYSASSALVDEDGRYCVVTPSNGQGHFTVNGEPLSVDIEYVDYSCTCNSMHLMCIDSPHDARTDLTVTPSAAALGRTE